MKKRNLFFTLVILGLLLLTVKLSAQSGSSCDNAIVAQVDTNHADNSGGDQWFVYTASQFKRVTVSTCNLTTEDTYVEVYNGSCNDLFFVGSNDQSCGNQSQLSFVADSGQTYYIKWRNTYTSGSYDWTLSLADIPQGSDCSMPNTAQVGTNHTDNSGGNQWFVYNAPQSKMVTVSTCNLTTEDTYVEVYKGNCNNLIFVGSNDQSCGNQSQLSFVADSGQTYYIVWKNSFTSGNYDWTLSVSDIQPGDDCTMPITAQVGTNHADNSVGNQWFVYTASQTKRVTVSTCNLTTEDTYVEIYKGNCNDLIFVGYNDEFCSNQSQLTFIANSGQTYYIKWRNKYTSSSYDWTLSLADIQPGDDCTMPITAQVGTNHADNSVGDQWFVYTVSQTKMVTVSTCNLTTEDTYVEIYKGNCNDLFFVGSNDQSCSNQSQLSFIANLGQTYYIRWRNKYTSSSYDWTLSVADIPQGSDCSNPIAAQVGTNHADNSFGDQWFEYTTSQTKMVTVSTCNLTTEYTYVSVYKGNCNDLIFVEANYQSCGNQSQLSFIADSGQTYYIRWRNNYTSGSYDWTLSLADIQPNDIFSMPIASENLRIYPNPVSGQLTIEAFNSSLPVSYVLYNLEGRQILKGQFVGTAKISTTLLKPGMYTLKVVYGNKTEQHKVIKQ